MNGFELRKQKKRKEIIASAFTLFNQEGVKAVKVSDIAKDASVSQVTIYNHFNSKEELVREVIKDYMNTQFTLFKNLLQEEKSFSEVIEMIILEKNQAVQQINPSLLEEMLSTDEKLKEYVDHFYQTKTLPLFIQLLQKAQERGEVNPSLSMEAVIFYLNAMKAEAQRVPVEEWSKREKFLQDVLHLFFYGLNGKQQTDSHSSE
ncbi:TetR/AcrR family transcriptional regulator [Alkalihalobacillus macyae]|uniref:TetR/AcrR family transcriptional regulator n=1 Tax=Guptibacillus hwajinpoensis TaxID=208199 RepID=UPI00273C179E|nr:TetR/AcrR family transcriptional regulator [Alkalihalobacillus macyae]MDP4552473.1 TetR/AcrR family transcriptional regulator [Alkalihalobacillus macyae]